MPRHLYRAFAFALAALSVSPYVGAAWSVSADVDPMTDEASYYAKSEPGSALETLPAPYTGMKASLHYACDTEGDDWSYFMFSSNPNPANAEIRDGYQLVPVRLRWDDRTVNDRLIQQPGGRALQFQYTAAQVEKPMKNSSVVLIEVNMYSIGKTVFKISLNGSAEAVEEARSECGLTPLNY